MKPKVLVGIPVERTIPTAAFWGFLQIVQQGYAFTCLPYMRCDVARNQIVKEFLSPANSVFTHLLMLDMDHVHPPDIVERLARHVEQDPSKLVIGGLNFKRTAPFEPCFFLRAGDGQYFTLTDWRPGLLKVDILGTGSILIAREVFSRIKPPWFSYSYKADMSLDNWPEAWPGVDVTFSKFCTVAGIDMWVDTTTTSPHITESLVEETAFRAGLARTGRGNSNGNAGLKYEDTRALPELVYAKPEPTYGAVSLTIDE